VYKPNSAVEAFRSLLETLLSVYVKDRYATGLVDVFAVSLPRLQRPVEEEVLEKAKDVADGVHPSQGTEEVASGGEEQREGQESGEAEEVKDEDIKLQEDEGKDNVMEDAHDDPVTTVEAMEEVEGKNPRRSLHLLWRKTTLRQMERRSWSSISLPIYTNFPISGQSHSQLHNTL
jgi:hypothetical protein